MSVNPVEPVLIAAWLVFAHLVADFVLQNDWIALNKGSGTRTGWLALGLHGFHVALCLLPVVFAFGLPGLAYLVLVAVSHMLVDRWKVQATRAADTRAQAHARVRLQHGEVLPDGGLGAAWTAWPGLLFLADQALHLTFALVGWLVLLEGMALLPGFVDFVDAILGSWDPAAFNAAVLWAVVLLSLFLANTRGAFYFLLALLAPRHLRPAPGEELAAPVPSGARAAAAARISATTTAIERLAIVALVLAGSILGALLVVALDAAARWRQLADREFAETWLLGTVAGASVALGTGLIALAALASLD